VLSASIIICTKDRRDDLARCIRSLYTQTRLPEELIVVDSGTDDSEAVVREATAELPSCAVRYLRSEPGLTRQRNVGIRAATQDILHFLDDDVVLDPPYVEEIQQTFEEAGNSDVVAVGATARIPQGRAPMLGTLLRKLFLLTRIDGDGHMQLSGFGTLTWYSEYRRLHEVEIVGGCCCAYRRQVFDTLAFDEFFAGYGHLEDLEFSYRAGKLGRMLGNPRATMLHVVTPAARTDWRRLAAMQIVNHYYVFTKLLEPNAFRWLCFWWSEIGENILRLVRFAKCRDVGILLGIKDGYAAVLSGNLRGKR